MTCRLKSDCGNLVAVTELLGIANYRVAYMVHHSDKRIDLVLDRIEEKPSVCSGCGKVHHTPVHSIDTVIIEDLPMSGKRVFLSRLRCSLAFLSFMSAIIIYAYMINK
jgi:hypothetical protein